MSSKRARDAEELRRRKQARLRFRKIIRIVALNSLWLIADQGDQKLSLNVKKNIALLVRPQRKIGLLTMAEKSMLRSPHFMRTVEERKKLVILLAGLSCFSKIPPKVCARLVPTIKFMYATSGRVIVREGDSPVFVYFILSGEVLVTKKIFDHLTNTYVEKMESLSGPGDCIGDIEIIENCLRRNTYTATSIVELLVIEESDFLRVLYPVMSTQWLDKKNALLALGYFKYFTEEQIINACKISQIRQFEPLETIYYEDKGHVSYVHFVISGECIILQCLKMKVTQKKGNKVFELVDISKDDGGDVFQEMTNQDLLKKLRAQEKESKVTTLTVDEEMASSDDEEKMKEKRDSRAIRQMEFKKVEISCGLRKPSTEEIEIEKPTEKQIDVIQIDDKAHEGNENLKDTLEIVVDENQIEIVTGIGPTVEGEQSEAQQQDQQIDTTKDTVTDITDDKDVIVPVSTEASQQHDEQKDTEKENSNTNTIEHDIAKPSSATVEQIIQQSSTHNISEGGPSEQKSNTSLPSSTSSQRQSATSQRSSSTAAGKSKTFSKVENRFIDVGSMTFGGIFGLGEKIEHRVVMARTTVQCLMLPRFWLFETEQNPGNIWQRRRFYLDTTIPSRQTLFADFLTTRKWQQFKKDLIESCVDQSQLSNPTKVQDVPIICRIVEANDD